MKKYEECATRLENRGDAPPTKEYVDALIEGILESGVEASWHSGVSPVGRALFPSKVYPNCHSKANFESFHYLIEKLHKIGRPVVSWYPLNMAAGVAEAYPDWRMQFVGFDYKPNPEAAVNYVCFNSPYGKLLPDFAIELVKDAGFDGIWFDGATFSNHNTYPMFQPGCKCDFCRKRFKKDTGLDLPEKVDYESHNFRIWVNWRYEVLMDVWKRIVEAVEAVKSEAVVCFNNYRRRTSGKFSWNTGIPMRRIKLNAIMSSELDAFPFQADIQMKINRAYGFKKGVESWWPLHNYGNAWSPCPDKLTAVQAVLGCISAGGITSCGTGETVKQAVPVLKEMEKAAAPRFPYLGGKTVEYAAIVASQQTMDFWAKGEPNKVWDGIHGANEILLHSHLQSSVIFEDDIEQENLSKYPLIILGNMVCISKKQAKKLKEYVEAGGVLFACDRVGELDELGYPYRKPILDDLLGIVSRDKTKGVPVLEIKDKKLLSACKEYPYISLQTFHTRVKPSSDVIILGKVYDRIKPTIEKETENYPGLWKRKIGKGNIIYLSADLFTNYLQKPTPAMQQFFRALITSSAKPKITLKAPIVVTMNVREQKDKTWAVHLHNNPGSSYRYPNPPNDLWLGGTGEVVPIRDIILKVNIGSIRSASSALNGKSFEVIDGNRVIIPELQLQDIILLEL